VPCLLREGGTFAHSVFALVLRCACAGSNLVVGDSLFDRRFLSCVPVPIEQEEESEED
jgi:hypothetical protein